MGKDIKENQSKYADYANKSLKWLRHELEIANPYAILLLGEDVISSVLLVSEEEARDYMTGKVVEKDTAEPIAGARVCVDGLGFRCLTDEEGAFSFAVPADTAGDELLVFAEKEGYEATSSVRTKPSETSGRKITLHLTALQE